MPQVHMYHFGFFLCRITVYASPWVLAEMERVAYNSGEMFLRPQGAMQDKEDQGVSDRKVSHTETIFLILQRPNSKRHGLMCTSLRRTTKKEETAIMWLERGQSSRGSLTAVGFTHWRPLPPSLSQRNSGRAVRHIHKQHLLSTPLFLRFIGRWWLLCITDKKRHRIWSVTGNTLTEINSGKETESYSALHPWSSSIKWQGSSYYSHLSGTTHHHLPFLKAGKDVSSWRMTLPKKLLKGREKYTNWFQFGGLVEEAASSK